ncbi:MAG TPA: MoaD/ThiS family protein [Chryseolinea sp.]|nr:MoaD/ThiS family protein [Chryseolinea sp.]
MIRNKRLPVGRLNNDQFMMNQYRVLTFGITRQLLGAKEAVIEVDGNTVGALRQALSTRFPEIKDLNSLYIAVNSSYSEEDQVLGPDDEIALIPPVSGG